MEDYMLVEMGARGLAKSYEPIRKLVPESYCQKKFSDLVEFMAREEEDEHGNSELLDEEKELSKEINMMVKQSLRDPNYMLVVKVKDKQFQLGDNLSADKTIYDTRREDSGADETIEYKGLDFVLEGYDAGGL